MPGSPRASLRGLGYDCPPDLALTCTARNSCEDASASSTNKMLVVRPAEIHVNPRDGGGSPTSPTKGAVVHSRGPITQAVIHGVEAPETFVADRIEPTPTPPPGPVLNLGQQLAPAIAEEPEPPE